MSKDSKNHRENQPRIGLPYFVNRLGALENENDSPNGKGEL